MANVTITMYVSDSKDMEKAKTQTIFSIDQNSKVTAGRLEASLGGRDTRCMNS